MSTPTIYSLPQYPEKLPQSIIIDLKYTRILSKVDGNPIFQNTCSVCNEDSFDTYIPYLNSESIHWHIKTMLFQKGFNQHKADLTNNHICYSCIWLLYNDPQSFFFMKELGIM